MGIKKGDVRLGPFSSNFSDSTKRKQDQFSQYAVAAASQAMSDSGLQSGENIDPFRLGVYIGTGTGGMQTFLVESEKLLENRCAAYQRE